jgi:hypothetical protein
MMEAVRTSETSVDNYFTRQYIPEDSSEHHTRRRENLKSHILSNFFVCVKVCITYISGVANEANFGSHTLRGNVGQDLRRCLMWIIVYGKFVTIISFSSLKKLKRLKKNFTTNLF